MTRTCSDTTLHSAASQGQQVSRSAGVGALAGGAQRTGAAIRIPLGCNPSAASTLVGWLTSPARNSAAYNWSPERSPVNIRPVRLAPCAAGASPTISTPGRSDPKPGTGRPQYGWSAKARRLATATSSRQVTRRGQARQTLIAASSSGIDAARALNATTCAASAADGV